MNCMKCGAEMKNSGVFCDSCLEDMEKYPVQSNITIHIPRRIATPAPKKVRRQRYIKPEDQIRHLKKVRNWLCALLIVALLAFAASSAMVLYLLDEDILPNIGQNYETVENTGNS